MTLAEMIALAIIHGFTVETQGDLTAVVVRDTRPNHLLQLFLTVFTGGLWLPVWIVCTIQGDVERKVLTSIR